MFLLKLCVHDDNVEIDLNVINRMKESSDLNKDILNGFHINSFNIVFKKIRPSKPMILTMSR